MNTVFKKLILGIAILMLSACATLPQTPLDANLSPVPVTPGAVATLSPLQHL
jgi:uncharacterized lipoprotein YajG